MEKPRLLASDLARAPLAFYDSFRQSSLGGWSAAAVLFLLFWAILRFSFSPRRRAVSGASWSLSRPTKTRVAKLISDADLRDLMVSLGGKFEGHAGWEDVLDKSSDLVSCKAKLFRPKDGPLKYFSVAVFEKCSTEQLRNFYMDNQYRKRWDKILIHHERLQVDESSGTEVGQSIRKFPLLKPREYILAWRMWEGKDKTFYCCIKDCQHPLAQPKQKYVRVGSLKSGWRIRRVPGRDACEIAMLHEEDAGINIEVTKVAFIKGIWSYVSMMNTALRQYYSSRLPIHSKSLVALDRIIRKVPPELESNGERSVEESPNGAGRIDRTRRAGVPEKKSVKPSRKWIANGVLLLGSIAVCLSPARSAVGGGARLAMACISKKLMMKMKHGAAS